MGDGALRLAYLGPEGTYSEEAAARWWAEGTGEDAPSGGTDADFLPLRSIGAVITAVETGAAGAGVVPIENLLEGTVTATVDALIHDTDLRIRGEVVVPVRHLLAARAGLALHDVRVLHAHPQSLGQCRRFVERCLPEAQTVAALSNAAAVADALADPRPAAAIGTARAAERLGAAILATDIADRRDNATRFVVLARDDAPRTGDDRTSFCFGFTENRAGVLVSALQEIAALGVDMTKLESRPSKALLGEYVFLVEVAGHREDPAVAAALARVRARSGFLKVFGSYPRAGAGRP